nr:PREDICTED: uncharacterized protein LOC109033000 [Bemisia tabaci]XP_018900939.1 PREDICTED: uncharacterized protein LOC109033000 [Bemisia tabaci]
MRSPLAQLLTTLLLLQASTSWGFPSRTTFHNPGHGSDGLVNDNDSPKDTRTRIVRIKQGLLRGKIVHFKNNNNLQSVEVFLGIPYAAAPVGSQRFMPPGSPPPWPGLMTADTLSPVCPQVLPDVSDNARSKMSKGRYNYFSKLLPYLKNQSEDCLYLNIYTPFQDHLKSITPKLPVIVFIHGESFEWNSGNPYDGSVLASYGKVIVVTINFRLGILGFLRPGVGEHTVSNFGLLDQIASLQWIKDNIQAFGGDPDSVTVMGHGTGAASVNFLMVSPVSGANGLFHRAILMSGSALSDWALTANPVHSTIQVAEALNCPETSNEMANCLRRKRLSELMAVQIGSSEFKTAFGPVIDGNVVPNQPGQVMGVYRELFSRYELMYGITEIESYHLLDAVSLAHGMLAEDRNKMLRTYMRQRFEALPDVAFARTMSQYSDWLVPENSRSAAEHNRDMLQQILSDSMVAAPLVQTAQYHAQANPKSYFYVYSHRSKFSDFPTTDKSIQGEELPYVFGVPLGGPAFHFQGNYNLPERLLSEIMMTLWTNFAKTGNPNPLQKHGFLTQVPKEWRQLNIHWPEYDTVNQTFLKLDIPPTVGHHYRQEMMSYWNQVLPEVLENPLKLPMPRPYPSKNVPPFLDPTYHDKYEGQKQNNWDKDPPIPIYKFDQKPEDTTDPPPAFNNFDPFSNFPFRPVPKNKKDEIVYGKVVHEDSRNSNNDIMDRPESEDSSVIGLMDRERESVVQSANLTSSITATAVLIGCICFLLLNTLCFVAICVQKSKLKVRERLFNNRFRCTGNRSDDYDVDDRYTKKMEETEESDFPIESKEPEVQKITNKTNECLYEPFKIASLKPETGGRKNRKRWGLNRKRSGSAATMDPHTKVREWITQGLRSRVSPKFLRRKKKSPKDKKKTDPETRNGANKNEEEEIYKSSKFMESSSSACKSTTPHFTVKQTMLKMENPYATKEEIYGSRLVQNIYGAKNKEDIYGSKAKTKEEIYGSKKDPALDKELYGVRNKDQKNNAKIYDIRHENIYGQRKHGNDTLRKQKEGIYGPRKTDGTPETKHKEGIYGQRNFEPIDKDIGSSNGSIHRLKPKAKKVNVAVDATPATRTGSVLKQIPIELTKSLDEGKGRMFCSADSSSSLTQRSSLKRSNAVSESDISIQSKAQNQSSITTSTDNIHLKSDSVPVLSPLSCGQVIDIELNPNKSKKESSPEILQSFSSIQFKKPATRALTNQKSFESSSHYEDINVTSRCSPLLSADSEATSEECLDNIKKRNFPKVLPDFPQQPDYTRQMTVPQDAHRRAKRMSLPPNAHVLTMHAKRLEFQNRKDVNRVPPPPPPRISTLGRKPNIGPINTALNIRLTSTRKEPSKTPEVPTSSSTDTSSEAPKKAGTGGAQILQLRKEPKIIIKSNASQPVKGSKKVEAQTNTGRGLGVGLQPTKMPSPILKKTVSTETETTPVAGCELGSSRTGTIKRVDKK